jgi:RHS repeat-associated protein
LNENLTAFQDRRGQSSSFTRDVVDRVTTETYPDATVARSYDANDRVVAVNDSTGGVFTFGYDAAGRLTASQSPFGAMQYTRDPLGRATSHQVTGQAAITYTYDPPGNLTGAALPQAAATFSYDARNEPSTINRINGVSSSFTYDPAARLLAITHAKGASVIDTESYVYDNVGNRASHSTSIGQSLATPAVATASYDADNEQTLFGATPNSFDADGDSTSAASSSGTSTYTWDSRGRLKSITTTAGQMTTFTYDFAGNLIQQTNSGSSLNLTQTFVLDDLTNVAYVNRSDGDQYSVLAGQYLDQNMAVVHASGQVEYGLPHAINNTTATVDQTGALKGQFTYEPFGQTTATNSTYPFQFAGRVPVSSGLYYNRARFYSTATGRFISEDPIGFGSYTYANNSPLNLIDPLGLQGCDPSAGAANFSACNALVNIANQLDKPETQAALQKYLLNLVLLAACPECEGLAGALQAAGLEMIGSFVLLLARGGPGTPCGPAGSLGEFGKDLLETFGEFIIGGAPGDFADYAEPFKFLYDYLSTIKALQQRR